MDSHSRAAKYVPTMLLPEMPVACVLPAQSRGIVVQRYERYRKACGRTSSYRLGHLTEMLQRGFCGADKDNETEKSHGGE